MSFFPDRDYLIEVGAGEIPGASIEFIAGYNPDIDVGSAPEGVW